MNIEKLQEAVSIEALSDHLGIQTRAGREALLTKTGSWTTNLSTLKQRSYEFTILQRVLQENSHLTGALDTLFVQIKDLEPDLEALILKASDLETEAFNELLFLQSWSTPLNFIPYLLVLWSILRVYLFPGLAIMMPLIMLVLPFIMVRFIFNIPLTMNRYIHMITAMFSGQLDALFNPNLATATPSVSSSFDIMGLAKHGVIIGTVVQSFIQPYWTFKHLSAIDGIIQKKAESLGKFKYLYESIRGTLKRNGFTLPKNPFAPDTVENRQWVAEAQLHPTYLKIALRNLGAFEVLFRAAADSNLHPVHWIDTPEPICILKGAYDYRVEKPVCFDIDLAGPSSNAQQAGPESKTRQTGHALLTGPNRGGKSTTLRSILASCFMAHTYGFAFAKEATMTPFHRLYVCLTPEDLPGKKSRFEREIEFTAQTLATDASYRSFVLLDELYHSTNPPDAEYACSLYTERLWAQPNTLSIISTHLFDFVDTAPEYIQRLCCPAVENEDGTISYSYRLEKGVSRVSSVHELLTENGMR